MILVIYLLVINIVAMNKNKPVSFFGYSYSYVPTESMEPTIMAGDSVIFKKVSYESVKVGDIVVYKSIDKGIYIIHRVVEKVVDEDENVYFVMRGDNNPSDDDEHVTKDMLIGKYVRTFNFLNLGKLSNNKNVIYIVLVVIFLGIIIFEFVNTYLTASKEKAKKASLKKAREDALEEIKKEVLEEIKKEKDKS